MKQRFGVRAHARNSRLTNDSGMKQGLKPKSAITFFDARAKKSSHRRLKKPPALRHVLRWFWKCPGKKWDGQQQKRQRQQQKSSGAFFFPVSGHIRRIGFVVLWSSKKKNPGQNYYFWNFSLRQSKQSHWPFLFSLDRSSETSSDQTNKKHESRRQGWPMESPDETNRRYITTLLDQREILWPDKEKGSNASLPPPPQKQFRVCRQSIVDSVVSG